MADVVSTLSPVKAHRAGGGRVLSGSHPAQDGDLQLQQAGAGGAGADELGGAGQGGQGAVWQSGSP